MIGKGDSFMHIVNRNVLLVKPRKPFVDWANRLPGAETLKVSEGELRNDCLSVLIPDFAHEEQATAYIQTIYRFLFEEMLFSWCTDDKLWPKQRSFRTFQQWFDIEMHSMIVDTVEDEIRREEF